MRDFEGRKNVAKNVATFTEVPAIVRFPQFNIQARVSYGNGKIIFGHSL